MEQFRRDMLNGSTFNTTVGANLQEGHGEEYVDMDPVELYHKGPVRVACVSQDRLDLSHASCLMATGMAKPTSRHRAKIIFVSLSQFDLTDSESGTTQGTRRSLVRESCVEHRDVCLKPWVRDSSRDEA